VPRFPQRTAIFQRERETRKLERERRLLAGKSLIPPSERVLQVRYPSGMHIETIHRCLFFEARCRLTPRYDIPRLYSSRKVLTVLIMNIVKADRMTDTSERPMARSHEMHLLENNSRPRAIDRRMSKMACSSVYENDDRINARERSPSLAKFAEESRASEIEHLR